MSESDDAESQTSAVQDESDWVITGAKDYVTNGPIADWIAVTANAEGRPAVFLISPVSRELISAQGCRTLGYNGLAVSTIRFHRAKVLRDFVLGPFDDDASAIPKADAGSHSHRSVGWIDA